MFKTDRRRKIELLDWVNENLEETYVHEANGEREEQRKDFQVNKFLGFGAVVIMIAAMGYVIFSDDDSHVQAGNQAVERTSTKTTASKEKNSQTTSSKVKDKETKSYVQTIARC